MKSKLLALLAFLGPAVLFTGCDFWWSEDKPFIPHPVQINPESDTFLHGSTRSYTLKEGWKLATKDTSVLPRSIKVQKMGDTIINGVSLTRILFTVTDGNPLPGFGVTHLGFNPARLLFDTVAIPDPGPSLTFPVTPEIGQRTEVTVGSLRFTRTVRGFDTLNRSEGHVQAWAIAESTYWDDVPVAVTRYSLGANGLLHLYAKRLRFPPAKDTLLWTEVTAL